MKHKWRKLINNPDYSVSNTGFVRSHKKNYPRLLRPFEDTHGYLKVRIYNDSEYKCVKVHTLVLEAFKGEKPVGWACNHKDGNKKNNHIDNLEWVTYSQNSRHAIATGLIPIGKDHFMYGRKLSEETKRKMSEAHKKRLSSHREIINGTQVEKG